mmetsp:Transcript_17915/g.25323  ORF Transcript_17915/g.25323 Transcript_17915/m.25323 type:complete len:106 (-) Transcript_17915:315-632(-)|eukprot:CAMPEP_0184855026 /NCGR_PEP_ID=MMETSP0580-20130426/371_1 /TAXON_ID=1118495 /ORGANISM="Dactyliosolen fragilissimus" /LENGTH=105 /DNA_ID=CAMNT_0027349437 /DNA_START=56 /DNA_END=373 /DNA_ORIENTATION=+
MADSGKYEEVNNYFKQRMAESKKIWETRGKDARIKAHAEKAASGVKTWRQMSGVPLMIHEIKHVGNKPFMWGFFTVTVATVYAQMKFSDESKASSEYWSTFHGKK